MWACMDIDYEYESSMFGPFFKLSMLGPGSSGKRGIMNRDNTVYITRVKPLTAHIQDVTSWQ